RPARFWAALAVGGELVAGVLFLLGILTPLAGLLVLATMAVAIAKVHGPKGFFVQDGGCEYNLVLISAALAVAAMGPGRFSLDYVLGLAREEYRPALDFLRRFPARESGYAGSEARYPALGLPPPAIPRGSG